MKKLFKKYFLLPFFIGGAVSMVLVVIGNILFNFPKPDIISYLPWIIGGLMFIYDAYKGNIKRSLNFLSGAVTVFIILETIVLIIVTFFDPFNMG